jgi:hypothetical protein
MGRPIFAGSVAETDQNRQTSSPIELQNAKRKIHFSVRDPVQLKLLTDSPGERTVEIIKPVCYKTGCEFTPGNFAWE